MNKESLTLADLVRLLEPHGMNRSLIQRYDAEPPFREVMQKDEEAKTYPAWTLPIWEKIAAVRQSEPLLVRPKLAARYVKTFVPALTDQQQLYPISTQSVKPDYQSDSLTVLSQNAIESNRLPLPEQSATSEVITALNRLTDALTAIPAPDDKLLSLTDAHEQYGVSLAALRQISVKEGNRRKVRRSDVLAFLRDL